MVCNFQPLFIYVSKPGESVKQFPKEVICFGSTKKMTSTGKKQRQTESCGGRKVKTRLKRDKSLAESYSTKHTYFRQVLRKVSVNLELKCLGIN